MKRKLFLVAVFVICGALLGYGAVAYFSASDKAVNVITSGSVNIEIVEQTRDSQEELVPYPQEAISVMPGSDVVKILTVQNVGKSDAWIRAQLVVTVKDASGETIESVPDGVIVLSAPADDWLELDGSYYYKTPVLPGTSTNPLLESVSFSAEGMGNEFQGCTVEIAVYAQALQVRNVPLEANGLPATALYPSAS